MRSTLTKALALSTLFTLSAINPVSAIYEKEKGQKDWRIENLGTIEDMKFIEESNMAYTLSKEGLISLFDTSTQ